MRKRKRWDLGFRILFLCLHTHIFIYKLNSFWTFFVGLQVNKILEVR